MGVTIDKPGQHGKSGQIDDRNTHGSGFRDACDSALSNRDISIGSHTAASDVDQTASMNGSGDFL